MPVSADRATCPGPHTRGKSPASHRGRAKSRETVTLCWREMDSNYRSPISGETLGSARHGARATFAARPHGSAGRLPVPQTMPSWRKPATAAASRWSGPHIGTSVIWQTMNWSRLSKREPAQPGRRGAGRGGSAGQSRSKSFPADIDRSGGPGLRRDAALLW